MVEEAYELADAAHRPGGVGGSPSGRPRIGPGDGDAAERRIGESLLDVVAESRRLGVDPELALRAAARDRARGGAGS